MAVLFYWWSFATTSSGNHSLDPSCERPSHFPSGFPCTRMMSRHSPCFRVRSVLLPLQSKWAFTWWTAVSGPTSCAAPRKTVTSRHSLVEPSVGVWKDNVRQTCLFSDAGDLLWISFWLPVPSSPVPSAPSGPSSPPPAVFYPSCPVSALPHPFIEGERLISDQASCGIACHVRNEPVGGSRQKIEFKRLAAHALRPQPQRAVKRRRKKNCLEMYGKCW